MVGTSRAVQPGRHKRTIETELRQEALGAFAGAGPSSSAQTSLFTPPVSVDMHALVGRESDAQLRLQRDLPRAEPARQPAHSRHPQHAQLMHRAPGLVSVTGLLGSFSGLLHARAHRAGHSSCGQAGAGLKL